MPARHRHDEGCVVRGRFGLSLVTEERQRSLSVVRAYELNEAHDAPRWTPHWNMSVDRRIKQRFEELLLCVLGVYALRCSPGGSQQLRKLLGRYLGHS